MIDHPRTLDVKTSFAIGLRALIAAGTFSVSGTAGFRIGSSAAIASSIDAYPVIGTAVETR